MDPGRFKSFPVEDDEHFLTVCRYAERNALRAGLVRRAEAWRWCSLFRRQQGSAREKSLPAAWPMPRRPGWIEHVTRPPSEAELAAIRRGVQRGSPLGPMPPCREQLYFVRTEPGTGTRWAVLASQLPFSPWSDPPDLSDPSDPSAKAEPG